MASLGRRSRADDVKPKSATLPLVQETRYFLELTEGQMADLASGFVPNAVKAMAIRDLDQVREDEKRAARPVKGLT